MCINQIYIYIYISYEKICDFDNLEAAFNKAKRGKSKKDYVIEFEEKLKEIKNRINDNSISYNEINCVLANVKGKNKKKGINYFIQWYQRTNCFRKCYFNKKQRQECRIKFQQLAAKSSQLQLNKKEFLEFFNNHVNICTLPDKEKTRFVSWNEFKQNTKRKTKETQTLNLYSQT